jgi:transposase-like protein
MPTPKLSKEKREAIIRLSGIPGYINAKIASEVGVSTGTVANVLRTLPPDLLEKDKPVEVDQIELCQNFTSKSSNT